ncbi:MAG: NAD-dependent dihydropyrimidine dehydrogenase subunit PreA [Alistipes sp.]
MKKLFNVEEEASRCLLCHDAPCSKACGKGDVARMVRALRFGNRAGAYRHVQSCGESDLERAEHSCIHYDLPLRLREIAAVLRNEAAASDAAQKPTEPKPSLEIDFCGIHCENPFFLASSAVCTGYDMIARAFRAGWGGVFYKTVSLQKIDEVSPRFDTLPDHGRTGDFGGFRNMEQLSENTAEEDFATMKRLKREFPTKIVVASIMGQNEEEWITLARMAEQAGADAVELNFSCPQMRLAGLGSDVGQNPELVTFYTAFVKRNVKIPVIPKMTPNITHINRPAMGAFFAGADAVSAINTIKSVTLNAEVEVAGKNTVSGYSGRAVKPIALRHILEMAMNPVIKKMEYSGIGGIETWRDALEFIQIGCRNVQVCTAVMQYGYRIIDDLCEGLLAYMESRGIARLSDLVGEKLATFALPANLDRTTVVFPVIDRAKCIGCGRCFVSCDDGGHQAIVFGDDRIPHIDGRKCVGCHLCRLVCPVGVISESRRICKKS